jgi:hypothetical protein
MGKMILLGLCICYFVSLAAQFLNDESDHWFEPFIAAFIRPIERIGYGMSVWIALGLVFLASAFPIEFL